MKRTVNLHIEHLLLEGLPALDEAHIGRAVQSELVRLLHGTRDDPTPSGEIARIDGGTFVVKENMDAEHIGRAITRNIVASIFNVSDGRNK